MLKHIRGDVVYRRGTASLSAFNSWKGGRKVPLSRHWLAIHDLFKSAINALLRQKVAKSDKNGINGRLVFCKNL